MAYDKIKSEVKNVSLIMMMMLLLYLGHIWQNTFNGIIQASQRTGITV